MKSFVVFSLFFFFGISGDVFGEPAANQSKNQRVLVMVGGGLRTGAFLGAVDGAMESGWTPDVLVTTCGSSMAAAIINSHPGGPKAWRDFVESREYYEYLKSVKVNPSFAKGGPALSAAAGLAGGQFYDAVTGQKSSRRVPDIFQDYLVNLPRESGIFAHSRSFRSEGIRAVIVASEVGFDKGRVGRKVGKSPLYYETFFTDPETAKDLKGFPSAVKRNFPDGYLGEGTHVYSHVPLYEAARASMSEPRLVPLMKIDLPEPTYFLAGSADSYPIEVAQHLGGEVVATASGHQGPFETIGFKDAFGFDVNARRVQSQRLKIDRWMDFTDVGEMDDVAGYGPRLKIGGEDFLSLEDNFPATYEEYLTKIRYQWEWGKGRAKEAFNQPKGSRKHLRAPGMTTALNYRESTNALGETVHIVSAPAVTLENLRAYFKKDDDDRSPLVFSLDQVPYLAAFGLITWGVEKLREWISPRRHEAESAAPSAWKRVGRGTFKVVSIGTGFHTLRNGSVIAAAGYRYGLVRPCGYVFHLLTRPPGQ